MARQARKGSGRQAQDDLWPLVIEFALSQRLWWVGLCADFELTAMQGHSLRVLDPDKPMAMSVLADALVCDASNVTGIVDKLESRGLIARQNADGDRRIKMLAVTEKGRALRAQLCSRMLQAPPSVSLMAPRARNQLATVLRGILDGRGAAESAPPRSARSR